MRRRINRLAACLLVLVMARPAGATWSIIIVDTRTREVAIGSATCLISVNLRRLLPVVIVDVGAAACQSAIDGGAVNRMRIWNEMHAGTHPDAILALIREHDPSYESRQFGIVDARGRAVSFSGSSDGPFAGGKIGRHGTLAYAIQGNVITGQCVIDAAEAAIVQAPFGIPEKLMQAMEAARLAGGDGRCSCSGANPPGCGCPPEGWNPGPPDFEKSSHVGFIIIARRGDIDGACDAGGCASGNYFMAANVANTTGLDPDPVITIRQRFDQIRSMLVGRVDAVESAATVTPSELPADGASQAELLVEARDWRGEPVTGGITSVTVIHDADSAHSSSIGPVRPLGAGVYAVTLTAGTTGGTDAFKVTLRDVEDRTLVPSPTLRLVSPSTLPRVPMPGGRG